MSDTTILQNSTHVIKPKKSVALSGVPAGNTALCTVGKSGNDLHYRGYDILDLAAHCEFEEVAHLLIHGKLPTRDELAAYKTKLKALRGLPANVRTVLEALPAASHPMDVMRTGVSALGCTLPEKEGHTVSGARDIADKLLASLSSILLYWYHYSHNGERIQPETDDDSIGGHFLHLLHGEKPSPSWEKAMHISLVLYAEHEFNASTFTSRVIAGTGSDMYSAIIGAIGALRGPKHGGANEVSLEIQQRYAGRSRSRYPQAGGKQRSGHWFWASGLYHRRPAPPGDQTRGKAALAGRRLAEDVQHRRSPGNSDVGEQKDVPQSRLVLRCFLQHDGCSHRDVHTTVCYRPRHRLGGAHYRTTSGQQNYPSFRQLCWTGRPPVCRAG